MASTSERFPGHRRRIGNEGAVRFRRSTAGAFRRPYGNEAIARDEFFGGGAAPPTDYPVSAGDGVTLGDSSTAVAGIPGPAADGLVLGDSSSGLAAAGGAASDGLVLGDDAAGIAAIVGVGADGALFGDEAAAVAAVAASATDGLSFGDAASAPTTATYAKRSSGADGIGGI